MMRILIEQSEGVGVVGYEWIKVSTVTRDPRLNHNHMTLANQKSHYCKLFYISSVNSS
jgi:hypothetical protein